MNKRFIKNIFIAISFVFTILCLIWLQLPCNKATLLWKKGYHEKAISIWNHEIERNNNVEAFQKLIEVSINQGKYNEAETLTRKALSIYPDNANFLFYIAMIEFYKGNFSISQTYTKKVIEINPYFPEVYLLRGMNFEKMGMVQEAKKEYVKELNNNFGNRLAWAKLKELKNGNI